MPDRARLAELERDEAVRRASHGPEPEAAALSTLDLVAVRPMLAGLGAAAGPGIDHRAPRLAPRGVTPVTLMAMQRLAGNRATVQALGRLQRSALMSPSTRRPVPLQLQKPPEDEEPITSEGAPGGEVIGPRETDVAAGPPDTGADGAGGGAGAGSPGAGAGAGAGIGAPGGPPGGTEEPPNIEPGSIAGLAGTLAGAAAGTTPAGGSATSSAGTLGASAGAAAGAPTSTTPPSPAPPRTTEPPPIASGGGSTGGGGGPAGPDAGGPAGGQPTAGEPTTGGPAAAPPVPASGTGTRTPGPGTAAIPAGPGGVPDPETAKSGIDWNELLSEFGSPTRTVLEIGRLIPGWGLLAGLGADSINFAQDLASIPNSENADLATGLVVFRNFVNIGNNAVGHILYVDQLIQDGLAGSVVGAEFTPLTAAVNEALSSVKVGLDTVQTGTDIIIEVEALYESNHAPTSEEAEEWKKLADGYAANILGDIVNLTLDVVSLASAGASNTAVVEEAKLPLTLAGAFMKKAAPNAIGALNNVLGVWLGSLMTEGRQAYEGSPEELRDQALAWDVAGGFVDIEGAQAQATYATINFVIDQFAEYADQQVAQIDAVVEALSGGKSTFEVIRDSVNEGLQDMTRKLGMVEQLASLASDAKSNTATISEACAAILGALDSLVVPTVRLPEVELGEGIVAEAAEAVANEARELANRAIRNTIANLNRQIDGYKNLVRGPVEAVQDKADSLGEWLAILAAECEAMAATLNGYIQKFSDGLARCTSVEQVIDLIIGQVSDLTGMPRFTVQEIRESWQSVGGYIDRFAALGPQMHRRATDLRAHADAIESGSEGPTLAAPPEPPPGLPSGGGGEPTHVVGAGGPPSTEIGSSAAA